MLKHDVMSVSAVLDHHKLLLSDHGVGVGPGPGKGGVLLCRFGFPGPDDVKYVLGN